MGSLIYKLMHPISSADKFMRNKYSVHITIFISYHATRVFKSKAHCLYSLPLSYGIT